MKIHHLLSRVITACVALLIFIIVIHYFLPPLAWSGQNVICQTSELHSIVVGSHWILEGVTGSWIVFYAPGNYALSYDC